ncbi:MAG: hypothetical protein MUF84_06920 [Anaerolineae bacterium]|jgi:hypothetical protein|nr:hypothetical protein [Anaerolineae bacterium]
MKRKSMLVVVLAVLIVGTPVAVMAARPGELVTGGPEIAQIRRATARYHQLSVAEEEGFVPLFECISHATEGAMGWHYILPARFDADLKLEEPEVLLYEILPDGTSKLTGVEYIVPAAAWPEGAAPPEFLGKELLYKTMVGSHEVDPYYEVHAWVWRRNPSGLLADWNPRVTCTTE